MGLAEDIGQTVVRLVDALTPRSVRMLLLLMVFINAYGLWLHEGHLSQEDKAIAAQAQLLAESKAEIKAETAKIGMQLQFMTSKTEEGNRELTNIREWLYKHGR